MTSSPKQRSTGVREATLQLLSHQSTRKFSVLPSTDFGLSRIGCLWHLYDAFRYPQRRQWGVCGRSEYNNLCPTWERDRGQILRHSGQSGSQYVVFIHLRVCIWTELAEPIQWLTFSLVTRHGNITRPPPGTGYVVTCTSRFTTLQLLQPSRIKVNFKNSNGDLLKTVEVNEGDDILSIAHEHDVDLEGA